MGDPIKPASDPAIPSYDQYRLGLSVLAGGGFALRNDGNQTALGPRLEVGIGPRLETGPHRLFVGFMADFIRLNHPLFEQNNSVWVKTFSGRFSYAREVVPNWLTLNAQVGLGLSIYGDVFREEIQNGVYVRESSKAAHMALGAGVCFWKERFCPSIDYVHDFMAHISRRSDLNTDSPNLSMKSHDTNGVNLSLLIDIGKFF